MYHIRKKLVTEQDAIGHGLVGGIMLNVNKVTCRDCELHVIHNRWYNSLVVKSVHRMDVGHVECDISVCWYQLGAKTKIAI